jgi:multidrug efflux system membrane fusion protein
VARVEQRDVSVRIRAIGRVQSIHTVNIVSQVTGLILEVHFKEGDFVKRDDLLFTIDTRPYRSNLAAAQAELSRGQALATQAQQEAERQSKLRAEGIVSQQEVDRARANAEAAAATLSASRAEVQSASLNVQFARIRSPIEGRAGSLLVHAGNVVKANDSQPLVIIRTLVPIQVRFSVPEEHLSEIRTRMQGRELPVEAQPRGSGGRPVLGQLTFVENTVDPATGTIDLKAEFVNRDYQLWPGQFVDVSLDLSTLKGALVVPEVAVQQGQEGRYAYVVGPDQTVHLRRVSIKRTDDGTAVIDTGLSAGETVVTDGQLNLREGSRVLIQSAKAPGSAEPVPR